MKIDEFEKLMTIFYSQSTGKIKSIVSGKQDMNVFGEDKEDYNYDFLLMEKDEYIFNNFDRFEVIDKKVYLKEEYRLDLQKYI